MPDASIAGIRNFVEIDDMTATAGQPTVAQLGAVRDAGYAAVVNLLPREQDNALKEEEEIVRSLGLAYRYIPVVWKAPQVADFATFCETMQALRGTKTFIHCAMNMRVTAFYSTYALKHLGWTAAQADALVARIWEADPRYTMDETWRAFLAEIRA
jgi:protein tyrosine phosphatase (PTP) superfamily phosphohydrolase (DUF442 family)